MQFPKIEFDSIPMNRFVSTDIESVVGLCPISFELLDGRPALSVTDVDVGQEAGLLGERT